MENHDEKRLGSPGELTDSGQTERTRYLEVLHHFALSQAGLNTLDEVLWNIAKTAIAELGFLDCVIYLVAEDGKSLIQMAAHGPKNPVARDILNPITIPMGRGIVGTVAETGKAERVADTRKDPRYIVDDQVRLSELAVPIIHQGRVIGVLDSEHPDAGFYTGDHEKLLTTIAALASNRIETALAMQKLEATVGKLRATEKNLAAQASALREAKAEAENASVAKSKFLASISHEIRTPMTAIIGFADLISRPGQGEAERAKLSRQLKRNADHLLALVGNVLDLSKIESGTLVADIQPHRLSELLEDVWELMAPQARGKGLEFRLETHGKLPEYIATDETRFRQVLINLLSNAIKYTPEGSVVLRLNAEVLGADRVFLTMAVQDSGIGISENGREELFSPFARVHDQQAQRDIPGTGLGLSIAQGFAELLGGGIQVESTPGEGSVFSALIDVGDVDSLHFIEESAIADNAAAPVEPSVAGTPVPHVLEGQRILVCEDSPAIAQILVYLLEEAGARVTHVEDGARGVAQVREQAPDLVLMDMQMPVMDGFTATGKIRELGYKGPIIALTAFTMTDDQQRCLEAGCDHYIQKPIAPATFVTDIARKLNFPV